MEKFTNPGTGRTAELSNTGAIRSRETEAEY